MSIQAVAWVLEQNIPDQGAKLVLISLANAYNAKSGRCFPSIEQIAVEASCSRATVKRKLHWLAEQGWIDVQNTYDRTGRQLANSYAIRMEGGVQIEPGGGFNLNHRGLTGEPDGGVTCEPPLKEPEEIPEGSLLSETSSDPAPRPKKKATYPPQFEAFWLAYPRTPNMSKGEAFDAWKKLDGDDRAACVAAVPGYVAFLKGKPDLETIHACRFISKRRFEGFTAPTTAGDAESWRKRLVYGRQEKIWSTKDWGPPPGHRGCRVPPELLIETDGAGWREWELTA